jgi:predicted kinase
MVAKNKKLMKPILFIFSGLPASGKSTLAQRMAKEYGATYLRIDTVEQGLRDLCGVDVQGEGYRLSYRVASDNLNLGQHVVADSCNPINLTRREWENVAKESSSIFVNIEVLCSDKEEHKRRVETRECEAKNLIFPTWEEVENREYHAWKSERITIDTANKSVESSFEELKKKIGQQINKIANLT